jgi:hypothetical protein
MRTWRPVSSGGPGEETEAVHRQFVARGRCAENANGLDKLLFPLLFAPMNTLTVPGSTLTSTMDLSACTLK